VRNLHDKRSCLESLFNYVPFSVYGSLREIQVSIKTVGFFFLLAGDKNEIPSLYIGLGNGKANGCLLLRTSNASDLN